MKNLDLELKEMGIDPAESALPAVREVATPPPAQWARCKAWIAEGLGDGLLKIEDIEAALIKGEALLWPGQACAIVTEFVNYPSGERASQVMSAGGDLAEILGMVKGMEAFARLNGCSVSVVEGRRGWEKVLKEGAYEFFSVKLKKRL